MSDARREASWRGREFPAAAAPPPPAMDDGALAFRPLQPSDHAALQALHRAMYPVTYDESFFRAATRGEGCVAGWAAVAPERATAALERMPTPTTVFAGVEQLVGFVTLRLFEAADVPLADRARLGLAGAADAAAKVCYVLTLGVAEEWRRRGVARALIARAERHAEAAAAVALYLHVIAYNEAAIAFYRTAFEEGARAEAFYRVGGREHDAILFHRRIAPPSAPWAALWAGGPALPALQRLFAPCVAPRRPGAPPERAAPAWLAGLFGSGRPRRDV